MLFGTWLHRFDIFGAVTDIGPEASLLAMAFSPDGSEIAVYQNGRIERVPRLGGPSTPVLDLPRTPYGMSWGDDDTIVYAPRSGIYRVGSTGGEPEAITSVHAQDGELDHRWPHVLPNGAVVFTLWPNRSLAVQSGDGEHHVVVEDATDGRYVDTGHLVFVRDASLYAVPFDLNRLESHGRALPVVHDILTSGLGWGVWDVSRDGTLAFLPEGSLGVPSSFYWVHRDGREERINELEPRLYHRPRLSPDGRRLALALQNEDGKRDLWIFDFNRQTLDRVTTENDDAFPVWIRDGQEFAYASNPSGNWTLHTVPLGSAEPPTELLPGDAMTFPTSWSATRQAIVFTRLKNGYDTGLFYLDRDGDPMELFERPFDQRQAVISPDGNLLAYTSDKTGQFEVYVRSLAVDEGETLLSTQGGSEPVWSHDGLELFFRSDGWMMSVTAPAFDSPRALFQDDFDFEWLNRAANYDVAPDGRFLMIRRESSAEPIMIHIVVNWFEELERLVPTDN